MRDIGGICVRWLYFLWRSRSATGCGRRGCSHDRMKLSVYAGGAQEVSVLVPEAAFGVVLAEDGRDYVTAKICSKLLRKGIGNIRDESTMQALGRTALRTEQLSRSLRSSLPSPRFTLSHLHQPRVTTSTRDFSASNMIQDPFKPAKRVAGQRKDVWWVLVVVPNPCKATDRYHRSIVNEAAEQSQVKPMVNMGQGFFGYNRKKVAMRLN